MVMLKSISLRDPAVSRSLIEGSLLEIGEHPKDKLGA
jgi:hypothetical protein